MTRKTAKQRRRRARSSKRVPPKTKVFDGKRFKWMAWTHDKAGAESLVRNERNRKLKGMKTRIVKITDRELADRIGAHRSFFYNIYARKG